MGVGEGRGRARYELYQGFYQRQMEAGGEPGSSSNFFTGQLRRSAAACRPDTLLLYRPAPPSSPGGGVALTSSG